MARTDLETELLQTKIIPRLKASITPRLDKEIIDIRKQNYIALAALGSLEKNYPNQFNEIGRTYELIGDIAQVHNLDKASAHSYLFGAMAYQAGESPAVSEFLIGQFYPLSGLEPRNLSPSAELEELEAGIYKSYVDLLKKDYRVAKSLLIQCSKVIPTLESRIVNSEEPNLYSLGDIKHFVGQALLCKAGLDLVDSLLDYRNSLQPNWEVFQKILGLYGEMGNSYYWFFISLLVPALKNLYSTSSTHLLFPFFNKQAQTRYLDNLIARNLFQLWPSQIQAIRQGLFDEKNIRIALSLPTSAGKTLLAESIIARTLLSNPLAKSLYIAPTRALVSEVEGKLRNALRQVGISVNQVSPAIELSISDNTIAFENRVLCMTPEKLDLFLRLKHELLDEIKLIVIDEGHLLEEPDRGQTLELAIIKTQLRFPETQIVFLSAVIPNIDEIAEWLGSGRYQQLHVTSKWRPTRIKIGEANISELEEESRGNLLRDKGEAPILKVCTVKYHDGEQIEAFYIRRGQSAKFSSKRSRVAKLAQQFLAVGNVLVLSTSKSRIEQIADLLAEDATNKDESVLEKLSFKIRREVDPNFELALQVQKGVAYHHGDLPPRIRYEIEEAARKGKFSFIVASTTLAEGVNLPVTTLIVDDLNFRRKIGDRWISNRMPARKFWNLAGRAGRALQETEGQIIVFEPDRFFQTDEEKRSYLTPDITLLEPVESYFLTLIRFMAGSYPNLLSFDYQTDPFINIQGVQSFYLALLELEEALGETYNDEDLISQIISSSLLSYHKSVTESERTAYSKFVNWSWRRVQQYADLSKEHKRFLIEIGLSLESGQALYNSLNLLSDVDLLDLIDIRDEVEINGEKIIRVAEMAFKIKEIGPEDFEHIRHGEVADKWIRGGSIRQIAEQFFPDSQRKLQEASNYLYGTQTHNGAWGANAVVNTIKKILIERNQLTETEFGRREFSILASYFVYGVCNPAALFLSSNGIERIDSLILGELFYKQSYLPVGFIPDDVQMLGWLKNLSRADLEKEILSRRETFDSDIFIAIDRLLTDRP